MAHPTSYPMTFVCLLAACAGPLLLGCGKRPARVPVSGQVRIDGRPLTFGNVRFIPAGARLAQGGLDANGRFSLTCYEKDDGTILGLHQVVINAGEDIDDLTTRWHAPKKYADIQTSDLTYEITGPSDSVVIELSWNGGKPFDEVVTNP